VARKHEIESFTLGIIAA